MTRPGAMRAQGGGKGKAGGEGQKRSREDRLHSHHAQTYWVYASLVLLGLWTMAAPFAFGYGNEALWVAPSGGRGVWFGDALHTELRAMLMTWSDVISGALLVIFGWRSLRPDRPVSLWVCCFVGIWLSFAPVVFWAPTAGAYLNDTIVGMLVIVLTVLIPGMPNMIMYMKMGPPTPPGWSYNPSSWPQRAIMIALGFLGLLASRYLAAFQLGYIDTIWDPFFGDGTRRVLNSNLSHMWPISDGALGALAFTFEFLMGWMGSPSRWRTMPWMVTFFGILVIPLGFVHIALVISQPVVVGSWCAFCLLAAALMLPMLPLEFDEVIAMGQHLVESKRRGASLWETFWKGGSAEGSQPDERTPEMASLAERPGPVARASVWGMSASWPLVASAALGIWMMAAPAVLGSSGLPSDIQRLGGALVVTTAVIAMAEPVRLLRFANILLGAILAIGPWAAGATGAVRWTAFATGFVIMILSAPRGPKRERYGLWEPFVW